MNIRPYVPKLLLHLFDSDSKSVTFGYTLSFAAHYGAFVARKADGNFVLGASEWTLAQGLAAVLVAGKLGKEAFDALLKSKNGNANPPVAA